MPRTSCGPSFRRVESDLAFDSKGVAGESELSGEGVKRDAFAASQYFFRTAGCEKFNFGGDDLNQARYQQIFGGSAACCASMGPTRGCEPQAALARYKVAHRITPLLERACIAGRGSACFMLASFASGETIFKVGHVEPARAIDEAERAVLRELRWWTADEIEASPVPVYPPDLAGAVRRLATRS